MSPRSDNQHDEIISFSFLGLKLSCRNPGNKAIAIIVCVLLFLIAMTLLLVRK
jgi:hypothetical protein